MATMRQGVKRPAPVVSPACKSGEHRECVEHLWQEALGRWTPCSCLCHTVIKDPGALSEGAKLCVCQACQVYRQVAEGVRHRASQEPPPELDIPEPPEPPEDPLEPPW